MESKREMAAQFGRRSHTLKSYLRRLADKLDPVNIAALKVLRASHFNGD
jgi:hypothetical protein